LDVAENDRWRRQWDWLIRALQISDHHSLVSPQPPYLAAGDRLYSNPRPWFYRRQPWRPLAIQTNCFGTSVQYTHVKRALINNDALNRDPAKGGLGVSHATKRKTVKTDNLMR
jgi:hypothetical protein